MSPRRYTATCTRVRHFKNGPWFMCVPSVQFLIENLDLSHLLVGRCSECQAKSRDIIKDYHLKITFFVCFFITQNTNKYIIFASFTFTATLSSQPQCNEKLLSMTDIHDSKREQTSRHAHQSPEVEFVQSQVGSYVSTCRFCQTTTSHQSAASFPYTSSFFNLLLRRATT